MSWIPMAVGAAESVLGLIQQFDEEPKKANYTIPAEVYGYLNTLQDRARSGMPGMEVMQENLMAQAAGLTSTLKDTATSGASLQGAVAGMVGNVVEGQRSLEIMNSQFKDSAKIDYAKGLMEMAEYKDRAWDINVNQPYIMAMTEYFNKKDAANQNLFGGLNSLATYGFAENYMNNGNGSSPATLTNLEELTKLLDGMNQSDSFGGSLTFNTGGGFQNPLITPELSLDPNK